MGTAEGLLASSEATRGVPGRGQQVLYLGINGVLHPSESYFKLIHGAATTPWEQGHCRYEAAPWLVHALDRWPSVRIMLSSNRPWDVGLPQTIKELGPALADRVIGFTYEELTEHALRSVDTLCGQTRLLGYSSNSYWRMTRDEMVRAHVDWAKPSAWVAVDDDWSRWLDDDENHVVSVRGWLGLLDPQAQDSFLTCMEANFGKPHGT